MTRNVGAGTITAGQLCYLTAAGTWALTDQGAVGTTKGLVGVAQSTVTAPDPLTCTLTGTISSSARTPGALQYIGAAGAITEALPGGANFTRILGYALDATTIRFRPSDDYVKGTP